MVAGCHQVRRRVVLGHALALAFAASACSEGTPATHEPVRLRRTSHGVLHVEAKDFWGLGFGVGYGFTEDNRCLLSHRLAEVRGGLSEQLGADAPVTAAVHDLTYTALQSDHYFRGWFDREAIATAFEAGAPEVLELADGYAAGISRQLSDAPDPGCPVPMPEVITRADVLMLWVAAATVASGEVFPGYLPHGAPVGSSADYPPAEVHDHDPMGGSNAWALGRESTRDGRALHVYNPHFPWSGIHRLYLVHATIPGQLDVFGVTLGGFPLPLAGFTESVAWGLTFSPASRWAASELVLEGDGKTFFVDGDAHELSREVIEIPVLGEDQPRRLPFFRKGTEPVIHAPGFLMPFTRDKAYSVRDINADNTRIVEQFLRIARSRSVRDVSDALAEVNGVPWSYVIAADHTGETLFAELSPVPRIDAAMLERCAQSTVATLHLPHGFLILDGNRSDCAWDGLLDPSQLPQVFRSDYVANSNNNYEWPNPNARLSGFSPALGGEGETLSLRANLGLDMIERRLDGGDGLGAPGFTAELAEAVFLQERNRAAELLVDAIVQDCTSAPWGEHEGETVDLAEVCSALASWDRRNSVDSQGALVFAGLWKAIDDPERMFAVAASADEPLMPPSGYTDDAAIRQEVRDGLATVARTLADLGIAADARWGDVHGVVGPDGPHAMPGGSEFEGIFDAVTSKRSYYDYAGWADSLGGVPPETLYGASYMHVVAFGAAGPRARGVLPYSQATEASSPWYLDQLTAWSRSEWFDFPFREDDIAADPQLRDVTLTVAP